MARVRAVALHSRREVVAPGSEGIARGRSLGQVLKVTRDEKHLVPEEWLSVTTPSICLARHSAAIGWVRASMPLTRRRQISHRRQ